MKKKRMWSIKNQEIGQENPSNKPPCPRKDNKFASR